MSAAAAMSAAVMARRVALRWLRPAPSLPTWTVSSAAAPYATMCSWGWRRRWRRPSRSSSHTARCARSTSSPHAAPPRPRASSKLAAPTRPTAARPTRPTARQARRPSPLPPSPSPSPSPPRPLAVPACLRACVRACVALTAPLLPLPPYLLRAYLLHLLHSAFVVCSSSGSRPSTRSPSSASSRRPIVSTM